MLSFQDAGPGASHPKPNVEAELYPETAPCMQALIDSQMRTSNLLGRMIDFKFREEMELEKKSSSTVSSE